MVLLEENNMVICASLIFTLVGSWVTTRIYLVFLFVYCQTLYARIFFCASIIFALEWTRVTTRIYPMYLFVFFRGLMQPINVYRQMVLVPVSAHQNTLNYFYLCQEGIQLLNNLFLLEENICIIQLLMSMPSR